MVTNEQLEKWIKEEKEEIDEVKGYWNEIIPEEIPGTYFDFAMKSRAIAIYNLCLGNKQNALKWFKESVRYCKKMIEYKNKNNKFDITSYRDLIFSVILTQDKGTIKKEADEMCNVEEKIKKDVKYKDDLFLYYYIFVLANLITEHSDKTRELLSRLDKYKKLPYQSYPINDAVKGILQKDTELVKKGINNMLKRHAGLVRAQSITTPERLVCIPVVCMLILAKLKGMNIKDIYIESKYIPKILFEK